MLLGAGRFSLDSLLRVDARVTKMVGRRRVGIPAPTTLHQ
jgi:hypothetical protein